MFNAPKELVHSSFFSVKLTFPNLQTYSYIRIAMTMSPRVGAHFCPQPMAYHVHVFISMQQGHKKP